MYMLDNFNDCKINLSIVFRDKYYPFIWIIYNFGKIGDGCNKAVWPSALRYFSWKKANPKPLMLAKVSWRHQLKPQLLRKRAFLFMKLSYSMAHHELHSFRVNLYIFSGWESTKICRVCNASKALDPPRLREQAFNASGWPVLLNVKPPWILIVSCHGSKVGLLGHM